MMDEIPPSPGPAPDECRIRAAFYRHLAKAAATAEAHAGLIRLAEKYDGMAKGSVDQRALPASVPVQR
jgi:hypothetical protein